MGQRWRAGLWWRQGNSVERVLQDRLHALIAASLSEECPFRRGFHALPRVLLRQANDAETGAVAHLRVRLLVHDSLEQLGRVRTDAARPVHHPRWRPFQMGLMTLGAVLVLGDRLTAPAIAQMGSDPVALVKDLHRGGRGADFHNLLHQSVRHTVKVPIEGNVVIDVDGGTRPLAHVEALSGNGQPIPAANARSRYS